MKKLIPMILILSASLSCYADISNDLDIIFVEKEYRCYFPTSFLRATCEGDEYLYDEEMSSVKKSDLSSFYRFVERDSNKMEDTCTEILEPKATSGKALKCNDFGIVLKPSGR